MRFRSCVTTTAWLAVAFSIAACSGEEGPGITAGGSSGGNGAASADANGGAAGQQQGAAGGIGGAIGASGEAGRSDASDAPDAADAPGTGSDAAAQSPECLERAIGEYRVRFEGTGFDDYNGRTARVLTVMRLAVGERSCRAQGSAVIVDGAFKVEMTNLTDGAVYPLNAAIIDIADDGQCLDGVDLVWSSYGSVAVGSLMIESLVPIQFSAADAGVTCALF